MANSAGDTLFVMGEILGHQQFVESVIARLVSIEVEKKMEVDRER